MRDPRFDTVRDALENSIVGLRPDDLPDPEEALASLEEEHRALTEADHERDRLEGIIDGQHVKYGPFGTDVAGIRLGVAVLEDEVREALGAWREERAADGWPMVYEEIMQVAAVALRLSREIAVLDAAGKTEARS